MIRPFTLTELDRLLEIEQGSFPKSPYSMATFFHLHRLYPDTFWVYVDQPDELGMGEVRGYLIISREGHLISLAVHPRFRRRGIGKALMKRAIETLSVEKIWAEVRRSNHGAQAFYQKIGFQIVGVIPNYYGEEDALTVQFLEGSRVQGI